MSSRSNNLPDNVLQFLDEYEKLCRKYNLMVCTDGEPMLVDVADEKLWWIRESTIDWWDRHEWQNKENGKETKE